MGSPADRTSSSSTASAPPRAASGSPTASPPHRSTMPSEFTENVIAEFRANRGRVGGDLADTPIILIHHIGATTRIERVTPLAYSSQPDGCLVTAASNGGSPTHPA